MVNPKGQYLSDSRNVLSLMSCVASLKLAQIRNESRSRGHTLPSFKQSLVYKSDKIGPVFESFQDFMTYLKTCKYHEDLKKKKK